MRFNMRIDFNDPYHPDMGRRSFHREEDALYNEPVGDYIIPRPAGYWEKYDEKLATLREQCSTANVVMLQNGKFSVRRVTLAGGVDYSEEHPDRLVALDNAANTWGV